MEFQKFSKIPRLSRNITISEKLDGSNAVLFIVKFNPESDTEILIGDYLDIIIHTDEHYAMFAGSRNRWVIPYRDNYGFARWAKENIKELFKLGEGHHYGEWYGNKIQRNYGLKERKFSLFNVKKWSDENIRPKCCGVVPVLYQGLFDTNKIEEVLAKLKENGSVAVPGFMNPEGIVILHHASGQLFKKTCVDDEKPKEMSNKLVKFSDRQDDIIKLITES